MLERYREECQNAVKNADHREFSVSERYQCQHRRLYGLLPTGALDVTVIGLQFWWGFGLGHRLRRRQPVDQRRNAVDAKQHPVTQPNGFSCSWAVLNRVPEFKPSVLFGFLLVSGKEVQSVSRAIFGEDIPKCPHHVAGDFLSALPSAR